MELLQRGDVVTVTAEVAPERVAQAPRPVPVVAVTPRPVVAVNVVVVTTVAAVVLRVVVEFVYFVLVEFGFVAHSATPLGSGSVLGLSGASSPGA